MRTKLLKVGALVALGGIAFGCLPCGCNFCNPCGWITGIGGSLLTEFLTDNDAVFDLFQDDFGTGTTYDDRFADPTRAEPDGANINEFGTG